MEERNGIESAVPLLVFLSRIVPPRVPAMDIAQLIKS
jgi:hypothetical protein